MSHHWIGNIAGGVGGYKLAKANSQGDEVGRIVLGGIHERIWDHGMECGMLKGLQEPGNEDRQAHYFYFICLLMILFLPNPSSFFATKDIALQATTDLLVGWQAESVAISLLFLANQLFEKEELFMSNFEESDLL